MTRAMLGICAALACVACSKPSAEPTTEAAPAAAPAEKSIDNAAPTEAAPSGVNQVAGLGWSAAAPLVSRAPKSSMRAAEYGVEGDASAELTVFYFGPGQGGSVDANITRWLGQLTQADGTATADKAKRAERQVQGITVTTIEARGNYGGGMAMPGMQVTPIEDALLLGAIAAGPEGPVFFKLIGPYAAVERARPAFESLIGSLHKL